MDDELMTALFEYAKLGDADAVPMLHSLLAAHLHGAELTGSISPTVARLLAGIHQRLAVGEPPFLFSKPASRPTQGLRDKRIAELVAVLDDARTTEIKPITTEARALMQAALVQHGIAPEARADVDKALDNHAAMLATASSPARQRVYEAVAAAFSTEANPLNRKTVKNKAR